VQRLLAVRRRAGTYEGHDDYVSEVDLGSAAHHAASHSRVEDAHECANGAALGERRSGSPKLLSRRVLLVLAVQHQIVDHGGIRQRGGVAETSTLVLGDLAQDAAHDLAGNSSSQTFRRLCPTPEGAPISSRKVRRAYLDPCSPSLSSYRLWVQTE
jgi:hypothetical protein